MPKTSLIIIVIITIVYMFFVTGIDSRTKFPDSTTKAVLDDCLQYTNTVRAKHGSPKVKYTADLNKYAKERCAFMSEGTGLANKHKNLREDVGENIYRAVGGQKVQACKHAIKNWYSEIQFYDFKKAVFVPKAGHFTQLIWAESTEMGCCRSMLAPDSKKPNRVELYIVCIYKVAGNVKGEYAKMVKKPK
ncbi:Golgi-associated plant pathogenesis-related protein 1-like [Oppia nitens]|uniref:Golgi-associated plant pathogenesis-related protein 1-like n=1 Tax=Oppia nitens TaxID=1686743 RepID=UPI0023D9F4DD|nr:Golgi-associated plant pathogenesis-related protein 1-like [Oppia nitens]